MTIDDLKEEIFANEFPKDWRKGQSVFNYIDQVYGLARYIQFQKGIDCFYNDDKIDDFLKEVADIINNSENK